MVGNTTVFPFKFTQEIISLMRPPGGPEPNTCSVSKSTQKNTETHYMSNTKSNPDTLIASFLLPWKVTNHSTGKEQPNNHKKTLCVNTACAPMPPKPHGGYHSSRENFRKKSKSQKVFDFSIFFDFSTFSTFSTFRFFRLFEPKSPGM